LTKIRAYRHVRARSAFNELWRRFACDQSALAQVADPVGLTA